MFNLNKFDEDKPLQRRLLSLITIEGKKIGRYVNVKTLEELITLLKNANYELVKSIPTSNLKIYRTYDIGYGYINYISLFRFKELIDIGKLRADVNISLEYHHGNIFAYVDSTYINKDSLLTDETYIFTSNDEPWNVKIGKPTSPNRLYSQTGYHGVTTNIDLLKNIEGLNAITILEPNNAELKD